MLDRFDPKRARLRTYLRLCVDGLVMNSDKTEQRLKRGGDVVLVPLDSPMMTSLVDSESSPRT